MTGKAVWPSKSLLSSLIADPSIRALGMNTMNLPRARSQSERALISQVPITGLQPSAQSDFIENTA
jgi:hypothetical protein